MRSPCIDCGKPVEKTQPTRSGGIRCDDCKQAAEIDARTPAKRQIQNSWEWRKLRQKKLARDPLCADCKVIGRITIAVEVHHDIARTAGGALLVPLDELTSLCPDHHRKRSAQERQISKDQEELRKYSKDKEFLIK